MRGAREGSGAFTDAASTRPSSNGDGPLQGLERDRVARGELAPPRRRRALRGRRRPGSGRGASPGAVRSGAPAAGASPSPPASAAWFFAARVSRGGVRRLRVRRRRRRGGGRPRRRRDRAGDERRARRAEFVPRRRRGRRRGVRRGGAIVPRLRVAASAPPAAGADAAPRDPRRAPGAGAAAPARGRGRRLRRGHPKRRNARWGATSTARSRSDRDREAPRACHARPRARRGRFVLPVRAERTRRADDESRRARYPPSCLYRGEAAGQGRGRDGRKHVTKYTLGV